MKTETKVTHTPGPWFVGKKGRTGARVFSTQHGVDGIVCAQIENRANAAFIVRACNSHNALVDVCECLAATPDGKAPSRELVDDARAALAQVDGGGG